MDGVIDTLKIGNISDLAQHKTAMCETVKG